MRPTGSTPAPCSTHLARRESPFRAIVDSKDPQMIKHTGPSLRVHSQLKLEMLVKLISCSVFCDVIFNHPCTRILARPHIECTGKSLRLQPMACLLCPKATAPRPNPKNTRDNRPASPWQQMASARVASHEQRALAPPPALQADQMSVHALAFSRLGRARPRITNWQNLIASGLLMS